MHHKLMRASARTAVAGAVIVLGSTAAAQGAMAEPVHGGIVSVRCNTPGLISAISGARSGEKLHLAAGCTYQLTAPLPDIHTGLTIVGSGATLERSEADGTPDFTILTVDAGDVNLVDVNFRNGGGDVAVVTDGDDYTGAIFNDGGNITVLGGTFTDNGDIEYGGAIYNDGDATVIGTTFTKDTAGIYGGALDNQDQATLSYVTIQDNFTEDGYGGGIYNDDTLAVDHSNIVHNSASYGGGGIFNDVHGSVTLSLTKVSGNEPDNCFTTVSIAGCSG